jgi:hypothetical protein
MAQDHMNAAFVFARQLAQVNSPSEFLELSTLHARKQFEKLAAQSQDLSCLAQKGMTETAQTVQTGIDKLASAPDNGACSRGCRQACLQCSIVPVWSEVHLPLT